MVRGWPGRGSVKEEGKGKSMNSPHKFGTEFGSDNAPEHGAAIVSHHDSIKWFEAIPGEQLCIRVHGTQVNGRYAIMENIAAPGTATPMHFHAEDEIFHILERDGDLQHRRRRFQCLRRLNCGYSGRRTSRVEESFELSDPHVDLLVTGWSRRALPQACRLVSGRAIYCSRTIRIRHCWATYR